MRLPSYCQRQDSVPHIHSTEMNQPHLFLSMRRLFCIKCDTAGFSLSFVTEQKYFSREGEEWEKAHEKRENGVHK